MKVVQASATAEQKAAADKAQPGTAGLFDDDKDGQAKAAVAAAAAKPELKVVAAAPAAKKGSGGLVAGVVVAVLGLAAAVAIVKMNQPPPAPTANVPAKTEAQPEAKAAPAEQPKGAPAAGDPAAPAANASATPADAPQKVAAGPAGAGGPASPAPATGPATEGAPPAETSQPVAANTPPTPAAPGKPGDLASAMQSAVGPTGAKSTGGSENAEPAAAKRGSQNVPEQPSQGSVQAAIGSVMGGAKSCVAGADDVSRAQITFSSAGTVSNVSVSGWAAGKSAASCIKSALKGASVGPFSKPTFTVGVTIRP